MSRRIEKSASRLGVGDIREYPVWEYIPGAQTRDEACVAPVTKLPVSDLRHRLVGTTLHLAAGQTVAALLGNIHLQSIRSTRHFMSVTVLKSDGSRFDLARYHDLDYDRRGPSALARFLALSVNDVFPVKYDISSVCVGAADVLRAEIPSEPEERLSDQELMELSLE
jgi:hypothetical protein